MTKVFVCSTGGHLAELLAFAPRLLEPGEAEMWVTFDTIQSRAMLAGRDVVFVEDTPPRAIGAILRNIPRARRVLSRPDVTCVVSSGAGIALSFLPLARARGIPAHYIESCARTYGPSMTGRLLQLHPGIACHTQHPELANRRWSYEGSVFDPFEAKPADQSRSLRKLLVTVGTLEFRFTRLLERLRNHVPEGVEVVVQAGGDAGDLDWPGARIERTMSPQDLDIEVADADVIVAHAGIGSTLNAFNAGKLPILVPRRARFGEHVDDHQEQIANYLGDRGLAVTTDASTIGPEHLERALAGSIAFRPAGGSLSLA